MTFTSTSFGFIVLSSYFILTVMFNCRCRKTECIKNPGTETNGLIFNLKDRATGNDIYNAPASMLPAPDSVKLIDIRTNISYLLFLTKGPVGSHLYAPHYKRPANIIDSLIFKFGNTPLDTLIIYTGIVRGWRGDECPYVDEPGITKVILRNQVLVETSYDLAVFTLIK